MHPADTPESEARHLARVIDVATGRTPPTLLITGGRVLNVYTGRLEEKSVALAGERIAYVGALEGSGLSLPADVPVLDASGRVLVPGYIEPHAHPFLLYNPATLAAAVLPRGTTTLISDSLTFFNGLPDPELHRLLEALAGLPVRFLWWARLDSETLLDSDQEALYAPQRVERFLARDDVVQAGELTAWPRLLAGEPAMVSGVAAARALGKRVEGHLPGASYRTLARLAAAGATADHEAIAAAEVLDRLALGYHATLRHSSIRPDLPALLDGLRASGAWETLPWHRLTLTTDGPTPPYLRQGFTDHLLRIAMDHGVEPARAYAMATVNAAAYYRLDEHLGGLAPGRQADVNLLRDLSEPTPEVVVARGRVAARDGTLLEPFTQPGWDRCPPYRFSGPVPHADHFRPGPGLPALRLENAVITRVVAEPPGRPADGWLLACLVDRAGRWITRTWLSGFARNLQGFATTFTGSGDLLVLGASPEAMAEAARRVREMGGGIAWSQEGLPVYELPLPILGTVSDLPVEILIERAEEVVARLRVAGHTFEDPVYTLLFLSSTHLPEARLTARGVVHVRSGRVLAPSSPLPAGA
ncbi:adenine deaminase C-terminal domain-containing protein [Limnochorda pilosa]|uniref:adenine deaminase n=1 Tax=Limnochorda pilosa TaxID=1555112 RepID=A0A0K2SLS2_LIMPI|nr:adenine deaminase C-terminal domain-containing protein [Limnochorda pilosa]BAS27769.1 adenine deaminase [Limnochorda pilosa]